MVDTFFPKEDDEEDVFAKAEEYLKSVEEKEPTAEDGEELTSAFFPFSRNTATREWSLAVPGMLTEMLDVAKLPGDVVQGKASMLDPATQRRATGLAMEIAGLGIAPTVTKQTTRAMRMNRSSTNTLKTPKPAPKTRLVKELDKTAPDNLETIETSKDLYAAYFADSKGTLSAIAERAGVPDAEALTRLVDTDTQLSATMRVNEAFRHGKLTTTSGTFSSNVAPEIFNARVKKLPAANQDALDKYLKLGDQMDDLKLRIERGIEPDAAKAQLQADKQAYALIEEQYPEVAEFAKDYRNITLGIRNFLASGTNRMISEDGLKFLDASRPNYVPVDMLPTSAGENIFSRLADANRRDTAMSADDWFLQNRDIATNVPLDQRTPAVDALMDYARNALRYKMENDTRGAYIQSIKDSKYGKNTILPIGKDEALDPTRVVEVYENGVKTKYHASKLQADLLRFDPYLAKYPVIHSMKRLFEQGTTGTLSVTFAPVTMIRDTLAGNVFAPKGVKGPGLVNVVTAPFEQLYAQAQYAGSKLLRENFDDLPFVTPAQKNALATKLGDSYAKSIYHQANEVGGFDASLMKTNIRTARGTMKELGRSWDNIAKMHPNLASTVKVPLAFARGFGKIFDAIQEAPRFATFKRNLQAGMDATDAVREAKKIAGDTTRSGQVYKPDGSRIDADAIDKAAKAPAGVVGGATEIIRESVPYVNPTIQGMRRMLDRFIDDPTTTATQAWMYLGMPAAVASAWNQSLGPEYVAFENEARSERDQTLSVYLGTPGKDPRFGVQIPIPHELSIFTAPVTRAMYEWQKDDPAMGAAISQSLLNVVENAGMIGFPVLGAQAFNIAGYVPPSSLMTPWKDSYEIREDNVGFLPQSSELLLRSTFGGITNTALQTMMAMHEGGPAAALNEFTAQTVRRLPVVKNVAGTTTPVTSFTPASNEVFRKFEKFEEFRTIWDAWNNPKKPENLLVGKGAKRPKELEIITPLVGIAPSSIAKPTNPIYQAFGEMVVNTMGRNQDGMLGLRAEYSLLTRQLRQLRSYTAGNADKFKEYQESLENIDEKEIELLEGETDKKVIKAINTWAVEARKTKKLVDDMELDLSKRSDVVKAISEMEHRRLKVVNSQLAVIERMEDQMTRQLHQNGMMPPNVSFDIERHLKPSLTNLN